nr:uncharacterized protein LOC124816504 isoform X6 [Hydra vulgaris]
METSANDASDQRFALILSELAALRAELNKGTPNDGIKDSNGFSFNQFLLWRTTHPGQKTRKAFNVWARQGGKDLPNF